MGEATVVFVSDVVGVPLYRVELSCHPDITAAEYAGE
jgi:Glu-tRNA(Gln) amidotransferase subunit E-like FAD-binding protein